MLKTLSSALQLMQHFTARQAAWGVRELAKESGVHHAIVHRVLATFAAEGYLVQDEAGRYALGLRWFEMGEIVRRSLSPSQIVEPALHRLAQQSGETVFLSLLDGCEGLCLDIAHGDQQLRFSIEEGQRFALHAGAHGKAILAFQPDSMRNDVFARATQAGQAVDRAAIEAQLDVIRENGWAYTREEAAAGVAGLAVPLTAKGSRSVAGSLAISGPMQRLDESAVPRLLDALSDARRKIESVLSLMR
ncbi:IclR family transcriptional regulator [Burkholderia sp. Bp9017]|uniref:IclR family transcriptional regulator n=1 Tax=Burkholderia anthina TaxID=179879 RepID=A0A7T7ALA9_9BURK|nr:MULTISPECIES: IclR family transcriptional regulator [Burkholderia]MBY4869480.1 IclR family transcriptional regulator [Burkholderia anthina]QQK06432.1 IclR family transcriptional regulator [Burkholderia anthina]RQZ30166.1 IclR family transcriptional regulator [Burkholderia sp. Bp9017]RQZ36372.1 IclR family transcriptional regulator [Burkholderia sp. Bp9016]